MSLYAATAALTFPIPEALTTILPSDAEPSVDKTQIEDVNVTRSSTVLGTVTVDKDTFIAAVGEYGTYDFKYNGTSWVIDATIVTLDTYGITYTGTAIDGNSIEVVYSYHKHFNFNIPRGLTGDVNFMTFEIKPEDGYLYMYRPDHGTEYNIHKSLCPPPWSWYQ